jgi:hypothetical protein
MEPLDLATFKRNSTLTIDAIINGLDGEVANLTGLTGDDIRWGLSARRGGPRLVTIDLDAASVGTGAITIVSAVAGTIRIQFRPPLPPADPDPFRAKNQPYWHECEVVLAETVTTQFFGPVRIEPSMLADTE